MSSDPPSPTPSNASTSSEGSSVTLPEALAHGREKRATAGNKLRALLDAEFQEDELFKEDENDEEFESEKAEEEEDYLSSSSSDEDEDKEGDEEEGERALIAEQKADVQRSRERKRKAAEQLSKPAPKKRIVTKKQNIPTGAVVSKAASTTSSVSNRRISFDPGFLAARRSSRALTVQTTNEVYERIISAAARRASQPVMHRRERTPPLTQEERLAQAKLTEEENKMSLKRIVEAEEERARKRREKLEALRRRKFNEPIIRFISRRVNLVQEVQEEVEQEVDIVEEKAATQEGETEVKKEEYEGATAEENKITSDEDIAKVTGDVSEPTITANATSSEPAPEPAVSKADGPDEQKDRLTEGEETKSNSTVPERPLSEQPQVQPEKMEVDDDATETGAEEAEKAPETQSASEQALNEAPSSQPAEDKPNELQVSASAASPMKDDTKVDALPSAATEPEATSNELVTIASPSPPSKVLKPHTPPPYHEANVTANTISYVPLPGSLLSTTRETFFPEVPLLPPPKPKPAARCPITGLPVRYRDPLSGVGYYDIHAFKILREVGRKGSRYIWCTDGGWFVGETGWGGRPAKGVPEGWNG